VVRLKLAKGGVGGGGGGGGWGGVLNGGKGHGVYVCIRSGDCSGAGLLINANAEQVACGPRSYRAFTLFLVVLNFMLGPVL